MVLVFGGAYQGMLEYALERFGFDESDVYDIGQTRKTGVNDTFQGVNDTSIGVNDSFQGVNDTTGVNDTFQGVNDITGVNDTFQGVNDITGVNDTFQGVNDITGVNDSFQGVNDTTGVNDTFQGVNDISTAKVICGVERWLLDMVRDDIDTEEAIHRFASDNANSVVICEDITCGVVPIDPVMRKWREAVGRALAVLARASDEVVRVFCGLPMRVK